LKSTIEQRLFRAMAELMQIAGWLSSDANRHADANRYLTSTSYAAHEIDHLGLAGHALGYMSLDAFYRHQPERALALAETALDLTRREGNGRTRASLHNRAARAHARLGHVNGCRRHLQQASIEYARTSRGEDSDPQWIAYVGETELAAQRGACYLDLGRADEAISELSQAIDLLQTTTPDHMRDLAHYKIRLASACLLQDELEKAVQVTREAFTVTTQIGSARVNERFSELVGRFKDYDTSEVQFLLEEINSR